MKALNKKFVWVAIGILILAGAGIWVWSLQPQAPAALLNSEDHFELQSELVGTIPPIDGFRILQGGCVTEDNAWFAMVSEEQFNDWEKSQCYILRYDTKTMQETARSEVLTLGHANDITYVPATNELYVAHCYQRMISVLDADTLTLKEVKRTDDAFKFDLYGISYNEKENCFITAYNRVAMIIYDADLKVIGSALPQKTELVTQGICSDDQYVYHVLYAADPDAEENENIILVLDWKGNEIARVPVGMEGIEPENISLVGDTFYIACNNSTWTGGEIYRGKLVKSR